MRRHQKSLRRPMSVLLWAAVVVVPFAAGCGNTIYAVQVNAASSKVEEAHELGAEQYAPYEYYYAREHLTKAQEDGNRFTALVCAIVESDPFLKRKADPNLAQN